MIITREQIEKIKAEALSPDVQEGLVSMVPNEVVSLCDLALKCIEATEHVQALEAGIVRIIECDHHDFSDGPPPRYVQIARALIKKEEEE